jgi:hypothetical protein
MVTIHGKFQGPMKNNASGRNNQIHSPIAPGEIRLPNSLPSIMLLLVF